MTVPKFNIFRGDLSTGPTSFVWPGVAQQQQNEDPGKLAEKYFAPSRFHD